MYKMAQLENAISCGKIIRAKDFRSEEIPTVYFTRLERDGVLLRIANGVYIKADMSLPENGNFSLVGEIAPDSVICLQSALKFHDLTDENPHQIHVAVRAHTRIPKMRFPTVVHYLGEKSFFAGIEEHCTEIGKFRVYSVEKTLVDCFKFRNSIGIEVAQSALREACQKGMVNNNRLWDMAVAGNMSRVMRPYLEMCI